MAPIHRLVEATDSDQRARDLLTAQAWGQKLTTEQFLQREAGLRAHPFAKQHLRTWLWVDEAGAVLSSCETFEVPARRGSRLGRAFVIASVFTEPSLRGKGHAVTLINAVCERLGQQADALAVSLFSEVGARIYERAGFVAQPSWDVVLPLETSVLPLVTSSVEELPAVEAPPSVTADGSVQLELTVEQCDWQVERERLYARALKRPELKAHLLRRGRSSLALTALEPVRRPPPSTRDATSTSDTGHRCDWRSRREGMCTGCGGRKRRSPGGCAWEGAGAYGPCGVAAAGAAGFARSNFFTTSFVMSSDASAHTRPESGPLKM